MHMGMFRASEIALSTYLWATKLSHWTVTRAWTPSSHVDTHLFFFSSPDAILALKSPLQDKLIIQG